MAYRAIDHVAINATALRDAEAYYCALFDLEVVFREAPTASGWAALPEGATWDDAEAAGIELAIVFLARDAFRLAIEKADAPIPAQTRLSHFCLYADEAELGALRQRTAALGCPLLVDRPTYIQFTDQHGIVWEVTSKELQSNGVGAGKWLDVPRRSV